MGTELPTQFQVLFVGIAKRMVQETIIHHKPLWQCGEGQACRWKCYVCFYIVYIIFTVFKGTRLPTILADVIVTSENKNGKLMSSCLLPLKLW